MNAVLISGLWPNKTENGLISLGTKIKELGHHVFIRHYDDKSPIEADILIGHSLGGEAAVNYARSSDNIKYIALIDAVAGGWFPCWFWVPGQNFKIPSSVERCDVFQRSWPLLPPSSVALNPSPTVINYKNIHAGHAEIPGHPQVVDTILASIRRVSQ